MRSTLLAAGVLVLTLCPAGLALQESVQTVQDSRLSKFRNIYDKLHPWSPPATRTAWQPERQRIREQLLVSNGLWPMPQRTPLKSQLGRVIERDGYTVQHVMFAAWPGHYVTGALYRPAKIEGQVPAVLCPHGHWANGRFYDSGNAAKGQLESKAETIAEAARYPLQARFVQLARMGCIVLHYDMVGYADSTAIPHRQDFNDAEALLWLTNKMGIQTWNSIRALDFVCGLPEVDSKRVAVTGASGGGTQTFMLAALDPRPAVAFPAVMVSTNMQGGCVCENASYLRIGINNIAIAALFAPRPMAMSGADDWTIDIERLGLPELRQVYSFYGKPGLVNAKAWPQYKHNYNSHSRQMMYHWFNEHLELGLEEPIQERGFKPIVRDEMTVYSSLQKPTDISDSAALRATMQKIASRNHERLFEGEAEQVVKRYREVVGTAAGVMFDLTEDSADDIYTERLATSEAGVMARAVRSTKHGQTQIVPFVMAQGPENREASLLWVDGRGHAALSLDPAFSSVAELVREKQTTLVSVSYLGQGADAEKLAARGKVDANYGGLTYCYNRPLLSERVRDVVTALQALGRRGGKITVVGTGSAGPVVLLAVAASGVDVEKTIVDLQGFSFADVTASDHEMMLPGALRYGDIGGLAALAMPSHVVLYGTEGVPEEALAPLKRMAKLTRGSLEMHAQSLPPADVAKALSGGPRK